MPEAAPAAAKPTPVVSTGFFLSGEEGFDSTGRPAPEPDPSSRSPEIPPNHGRPRGLRPEPAWPRPRKTAHTG
jgi:hypothetical protein